MVVDLSEKLKGIVEGVQKKEHFRVSKVAKHDHKVRRGLTKDMLKLVIESVLAPKHAVREQLLVAISNVKEDVDMEADNANVEFPKVDQTEFDLPEVAMYLRLLCTMYLLDHHQNDKAAEVATAMMEQVAQDNRRSMDHLTSKAFYFYSLAFERLGKLADVRPRLMKQYRTSCLRHDQPGQATLLNLILRNFMQNQLYTQAEKFIQNTEFPSHHSNYQRARYLYYRGVINCLQLRYTDAHEDITQAIRRAPQNSANGFREHAYKMLVLVQLLLGDVPDLAVFSSPGIARALEPYLELTRAVRVGDLSKFASVQKRHKDRFVKDRAYNLITRLRRNVIKTGLRKISLSYSRISVDDIATKLGLETKDDAEYVIAKAIHDGSMDAVIDREQRLVFSKESVDNYSTDVPQEAFHQRIQFCIEDIHNEAVKAMRFPDEQEGNEEPQPNDMVETVEMALEMLDADDEEDDFMD